MPNNASCMMMASMARTIMKGLRTLSCPRDYPMSRRAPASKPHIQLPRAFAFDWLNPKIVWK